MTASTRRAPRPDDLYRMLLPSDPRLSPDGRHVAFTVQRVAPTFDGYRTAIWLGPTDGSEPSRVVTLSVKRDWSPRWSPDGRFLAFLSDRRPQVEEEPGAPTEREDIVQVHMLSMDRPGEARRVSDLPRGVEAFAWSPDGRWLAVRSASHAADRAADHRSRRKLGETKPGEPPARDYRFFDRLRYQDNAAGFVAHQTGHLWLIDPTTGAAKRLSDLPAGVDSIVWSPDSRRIAITTGAARDYDLHSRSRILLVDIESGGLTTIASHPKGAFAAPAWLPDGSTLVALGGLVPDVFYGFDILAFASDGSDDGSEGRLLASAEDVMPGSTMNSDLTLGEGPRLFPTPDGSGVLFLAPHEGATQVWRVDLDGLGRRAAGKSSTKPATKPGLSRLTKGEHYLSGIDVVGDADGNGLRVAVVRSSPVELPDIHVAELPSIAPTRGSTADLRRLTDLNRVLLDEVELQMPSMRWTEVDGRRIQSWNLAAPGPKKPRPTVLEIHGGPHTLYGWSPFWEFQVLAADGISVAYSNPRGSEGYGRTFNEANLSDWGPGPSRDVLGVLDALVAEGLADADRLGVTGGSYGGYLTNWLLGHDQRFKAAFTARSVADLTMLFLTGDLSGTDWPEYEFGGYPHDKPEHFREQSPITYASNIRTPLLIQHSERDLRTTVGQAEALFAVLRRLRRPVRLMRVPDETHELTRAGTPHRRVENLVQVRNWFHHFLIDGKRTMPRRPDTKHGH